MGCVNVTKHRKRLLGHVDRALSAGMPDTFAYVDWEECLRSMSRKVL